MRHPSIAVLLSTAVLLAACENSGSISEPVQPPERALVVASAAAGGPDQPFELLDQCDPATFNAAVGPGTCMSGHHGITFDKLIGQLTANQNAPAWRISPSNRTASFGSTLVATNRGGEVHSFTRVAAFGGGIIPFLNDLVGETVQAPECVNAPPSEYLGPGGVDHDLVDQHGTLNYQCCIHPWMRAVVNVK